MIFYVEKDLVGTFDLNDEFITEDNIGTFQKADGGKSAEVYVYPSEGDNIPHFHIINKISNPPIDVCVQIYDNRYFEHGCHSGTLNSVAEKNLNKWLKKLNKTNNSTNWEYIVELWNKGHQKWEEFYKNNPMSQPDYSFIKPYKCKG